MIGIVRGAEQVKVRLEAMVSVLIALIIVRLSVICEKLPVYLEWVRQLNQNIS